MAQLDRSRLDVELVRRGLARARGHAHELVVAGRVQVGDRFARRPAERVGAETQLNVRPGPGPDYVGRGALKLAGFLEELASVQVGGLVAGRRCLDAGASTGGFTQVLLQRGAAQVVAVDVGRDQLVAQLRADERVVNRPGTSVRGLAPADIGGRVDLLVADLSFISLRVVLADLVALVRRSGDLLLLVKPQFEVGRQRLGSGGVVRDGAHRLDAVLSVARAGVDLHGLAVRDVRASRWPGASGNVEYFLWLTRQDRAPLNAQELSALRRRVEHAVRRGPT